MIDSLENFIEKLKESNKLIIVEGKKDRIALESFGISNIIELSKDPIFSIIEKISESNDDCIILTDLDRKGRELFGRLNGGLQRHGVVVDNSFREFLFRDTKLRQIEGLRSHFDNIQRPF